MPYKNTSTCIQELPKEWADRYNTIDKICAGFYKQGKGVCPGDSGNGLVVLNPADKKYYVHGIVSLGHSGNGLCNSHQNALYTNVTFYYDFIEKELNKLGICKLPPYPENGNWSVGQEDVKPGDKVYFDTVLKFTCNQGYVLSSDDSYVECYQAEFKKITCQLTCPEIDFPTSTFMTCVNQKNEAINCSKAVNDTALFYVCGDGFQEIIRCIDGSWSRPQHNCKNDLKINEKRDKRSSPKLTCSFGSWESLNISNLEDFNVTLCDYVVYPFADVTWDGKLKVKDEFSDIGTNKRGLHYTVTEIKKKHPKLKILISIPELKPNITTLFSSIAADLSKKSEFIESVKNLLQAYNLDGLNIEWNIPRSEDKTNYILLLREAKEALKEHGWLFTTTVGYNPETSGYNGSQIIEYLDSV